MRRIDSIPLLSYGNIRTRVLLLLLRFVVAVVAAAATITNMVPCRGIDSMLPLLLH